jgi:hypothetical protein
MPLLEVGEAVLKALVFKGQGVAGAGIFGLCSGELHLGFKLCILRAKLSKLFSHHALLGEAFDASIKSCVIRHHFGHGLKQLANLLVGLLTHIEGGFRACLGGHQFGDVVHELKRIVMIGVHMVRGMLDREHRLLAGLISADNGILLLGAWAGLAGGCFSSRALTPAN